MQTRQKPHDNSVKMSERKLVKTEKRLVENSMTIAYHVREKSKLVKTARKSARISERKLVKNRKTRA